MIEIETPMGKASIQNFEWSSNQSGLAKRLNDLTEDLIVTPDLGEPDWYIAVTVAKKMGGRVLSERPILTASTGEGGMPTVY